MGLKPEHGFGLAHPFVAHPDTLMANIRRNIVANCLLCGMLITRMWHSNTKFCSRSCSYTYNAGFLSGPKYRVDEKFWSRTKPDQDSGCILWIGPMGSNGYGRFYDPVTNKPMSAHRVSFLLHHGHYPINLTRHTCDNKSCVNPMHLLEGTNRENAQDAIDRFHMPTGEKRVNAKLNDAVVRYIRSSPKSSSALSRELGVGYSTIAHARKYRSWKHVI